MIELGLLFAQEFASGGCIEKQVTHFHCGALGMRSGLKLHFHIAPFTSCTDALAALLVGITGERQARY